MPFDRARLRRVGDLDEQHRHARARRSARAALERIGRLADEHPDLRGQAAFTMPYVTAVVRAARV